MPTWMYIANSGSHSLSFLFLPKTKPKTQNGIYYYYYYSYSETVNAKDLISLAVVFIHLDVLGNCE